MDATILSTEYLTILTSVSIPDIEGNFTEHRLVDCYNGIYFRILIDLYEIQIMDYIEVWGINVNGN